MKIILTESQYKTIIEQNTSCQPRKVTKQVIDSVLPEYKNDLSSSVRELQSSLVEDFSKTASDRKIIDIFNKAIAENFNLLYTVGVKSCYANYGISGPYNQTADVQAIVNNLINKVISTIDSNFVYRQALKMYINKNNINAIKEEFSNILLISFRELNRLLLKSEYGLDSMIENKMGRCSNGEYNLVYNKKATTEYRVLSYYRTKLVDLNKKLDSFV